MESGKILSEAAKYLGSGIVFKDHAIYACITIILVTIINHLFNYLMRRHRITSDEYIDKKGNPRKKTYLNRR
jgi:hypothetical protein